MDTINRERLREVIDYIMALPEYKQGKHASVMLDGVRVGYYTDTNNPTGYFTIKIGPLQLEQINLSAINYNFLPVTNFVNHLRELVERDKKAGHMDTVVINGKVYRQVQDDK